MTHSILCGFCNEPTHDLHSCEEAAYFEQDLDSMRVTPNGMTYSVTSIAMAELFLKEYPEFNDQPNAVGAYFKIGVGITREQEDWITPVDYEEDTNFPVVTDWADDLTDREAEWQGIYDLRETQPNLSSWRDVEPTRCTTAFHWWTKTRSPKIYMDAPNHVPEGFNADEVYVNSYEALDFSNSRLMRLEFHELQSFASELLIDADITERFQYKVFNAYVGRDEKFHIGLLTFERPAETIVNVQCKRGGCRLNVSLDISAVTRDEMEDFVLNCIRHGNNHGPDWLINRSDFTKIHANNCDTLHSDLQCNANSPRYFVNELNASDFDAVFTFLIQHRKFCTNSDCRCTHYYHMLNERNYNGRIAA